MSNLWSHVTFDDLGKYIHTGVKENIERNNMDIQGYVEWRLRDWKDFCREMCGNDIEGFEDILSDSDYIRSYSNHFYSLNAWEIRRFIKKRISELKALERVTPYVGEEVWEWKNGFVDFYGHVYIVR